MAWNGKRYILSLFVLFISIFAQSVFAGKDPIKWNLTQGFPTEVFSAGATYVAEYTFTNQLPFTLAKPLVIQKNATPASEFTYNDLCTGKRLQHLQSCTVSIYLTPKTSGLKTLQLIEVYANDHVPLPKLTATASGNSGGTGVVGSRTIALTSPLGVNQSSPWKFTFTNEGTAPATGLNLAVSGSAYSTTCGLTLSNIAPNNSCTVEGTFTATSTGPAVVSATLSYAQGAPVEVSTSTNGSGTDSGLVCTPAVPLAPETLINTVNPVTLLCTNKTGGAISITGHTTVYPAEFVVSPGGDNCTNQTLNNAASCQLKGTYTAPGVVTPGVVISLSVDYVISGPTLSSSTLTSTSVVDHIDNLRKIHLVNNCNYNVWWSMVGGAVSGSPSCASCPSGSTCNSGICYYNGYGPTSGGYQLNANGGTADTQIIETEASTSSDHILWKGLISASTKCSGTSCQNNDCQSNGGTTSCAPGVGFKQPATEAEFTFLLTGAGNVDTYDITNVNGFSMPMSMASNQTASGYTCGTAGNNVAVGSLKACNFSNVTPPTNMYYWVTNSGSCTAQNTCTNGTQICGLAFNPSTNNFQKSCGDFLGYWSANQICQTTPSFTSPFGDSFSCSQVLGSPFPANTYTLTQLMKCSPPLSTAPLFNSCYLTYSGYSSTQLQQCCGCTDWTGIATPSAACPAGQSDPQWTSYVLGLIQWMKQACPTSYSYPYDDKASTFQCTADQTTEYTITFCPGGGTGLPANKTDGRA